MDDALQSPSSAVSITSDISSGRFSIEDVIENCLSRCEAVQDKLNPFTDIYKEEARHAAASADARLLSGEPCRLMEGVPVAIKEFTPIRGKKTTRGSAALKDHVAEDQPVIINRLLDAGAIIVARTTTPEFAHSSFTRSPLQGHTRNPFDPSRTCGGSSGGQR